MSETNIVIFTSGAKSVTVLFKNNGIPTELGDKLYNMLPKDRKTWKNGKVFDVDGVPHIPVHYLPDNSGKFNLTNAKLYAETTFLVFTLKESIYRVVVIFNKKMLPSSLANSLYCGKKLGNGGIITDDLHISHVPVTKLPVKAECDLTDVIYFS